MTKNDSNPKSLQTASAVPPPISVPPTQANATPNRPGPVAPPLPPSRKTDGLNQFPFPVRDATPPLSDRVRDENDSQLSNENWFWRTFWQMPSWLTSAVLHVAIILILALIPVREEIGNTLSLILGLAESSGDGDELDSFDLNHFSLDNDPSEDIGKDLSLMATEVESSIVDVSSLNTDVAKVPLTLKAGLSSRTGLMRDAMLKAYGGTSETERAVAMGLEWLKKNQTSDGSWSLAGPYSEGGVNENRPAATAMALLAFMGAGNTHREGAYQNNVTRGLDYLLSIQDDDGFFAAKSTGIQRTYSQAQASIALCELYGMTGDEKLKLPAQRAVRWALDAQSDAGGWRYQPREDSDTSVTGWYVMALISARMAGMDVDSQALEKVHQFLDSVQRASGENRPNPQGDKYAYVVGGKDKDSMTAEGILCRMYLGWKTTDPRIAQGCDYLASRPITSDMPNRNYYYWYYATNSLHHAGGAAWFRWNQVMREALPAMQIQSGRERGSWPPQGDPHGDAGGRLYSTVLAVLCLEAYYRHMPLSEMAHQE
ncbi:MAG: prenyltransferase/squalene oxidase repeat-containing protein [Planctomycetota bacterium]|jgi:hypothetical protein